AGTVFFGRDCYDAFSGDAIRLLGSLGQTLGAQPVDSCFDVAVGFNKRLLAVHHADARTLAKFLHEGGSDLGHVLLLKFDWAAGPFSPAACRFNVSSALYGDEPRKISLERLLQR